jgi:glycerol-3-phosphate acyltransferase PlsY
MLATAATIVGSYVIGSIPIAYLTGHLAKGVDIRDVGSGNVGASNVWQSVSKGLVVPVGLAQIAQGAAAVLIAKAAGQHEGVQVAAALASLIANDWNPWLRLTGGRGVGQTIGVLLVLAPWALVAFIFVALAGVALRAIPQAIALALVATPIAAAFAGQPASIIGGCAVLAGIALVKRVLANGAPDASSARPGVWLLRLIYDRDIHDRDAWVRRKDAGQATQATNP